jgi:hypothetical protein
MVPFVYTAATMHINFHYPASLPSSSCCLKGDKCSELGTIGPHTKTLVTHSQSLCVLF